MQTLIDNLATDIRIAFPESMGYSVRNLKYMAKFAARFSDRKIVQEELAQITWYHKVLIHHKFLSFPMKQKKRHTAHRLCGEKMTLRQEKSTNVYRATSYQK